MKVSGGNQRDSLFFLMDQKLNNRMVYMREGSSSSFFIKDRKEDLKNFLIKMDRKEKYPTY